MSKDLPYFRFYPSEWTGGRIFSQSYEIKGVFIDLLCRYWKNQGNYSYEEACLDFDKKMIDFLIDKKIIVKEEKKVNDELDDYINICFMQEQIVEIEKEKKKKSKAGKVSAKQRGNKPQQAPTDVQQNSTPVDTCSTPVQHNSTPAEECSANNINRSINNNRNNKKFIKPTLLEIKQYISENKYNVEPEAFIDHYESVGWVIGDKKPMKDWQAAVRNWHRRNNRASPAIASKLGVSQKTANNMQVVKGFLETRGVKVNAE